MLNQAYQIQELKSKLTKQIKNCPHPQTIGSRCFCRQINCSYPSCKACSLTLKTIDQHFQKKHSSKPTCPHGCFKGVLSKKFFVDCSIHNPNHPLNLKDKMKKSKKTKNQVIVVPTTQQSIPPIKSVKKSAKPRSKEDTLAYYGCLLEQIANHDKVKITKLCNWCRGNKGKVAWSKSEAKRELAEKVAKSYLEFGKGLGHLLHANIVGCKCK